MRLSPELKTGTPVKPALMNDEGPHEFWFSYTHFRFRVMNPYGTDRQTDRETYDTIGQGR